MQSYAALDAPEILRSNLFRHPVSRTLSRQHVKARAYSNCWHRPLELHELVIPLPIFEGQNLEQEHSAFAQHKLQNVQSSGQIAHRWIGPLLSIRVKQLNERGEAATMAESQATENGRRITLTAATM